MRALLAVILITTNRLRMSEFREDIIFSPLSEQLNNLDWNCLDNRKSNENTCSEHKLK